MNNNKDAQHRWEPEPTRTEINKVADTSHAEAMHLLALLSQRRIEPQVATVALMFTTAMLLSSIATDADNLQTMIKHACALLEHRARDRLASRDKRAPLAQ